MKTNIYKEIYKKIEESNYILILTHKNPDPDTIGSALALSGYLQNKRKKHKVFNFSKESQRKLNFLAGFEKITNRLPQSYDLVIYIDCSEDYMVGASLDKDIFSIAIDHHQTSKQEANICLIDPSSGSTGELVFEFYRQNNIKFTKEIATALYVAIFDDTVGFTVPRTSEQTFEKITELVKTGIEPSFIADKLIRQDSLAKYRALPKVLNTLELHCEGRVATIYLEDEWVEETGVDIAHIDGVTNMVLNIAVVNIAVYFRKVDSKVRVSLRGKGDIDLSKLAQHFNGGGHKNAAGFYMENKSLELSKEEFLDFFKNYTFD